jgi:hypothetical protein
MTPQELRLAALVAEERSGDAAEVRNHVQQLLGNGYDLRDALRVALHTIAAKDLPGPRLLILRAGS